MAETPLSIEELNLSKDSQVRSLPGRFESTSQTVSSFSNVFIYDLGADYFSRFPAMLSGVTAEQVRTVAHKYLVPEKMIIVAVGDRARTEPEIAKLGLGTIEIRDADGSVKDRQR